MFSRLFQLTRLVSVLSLLGALLATLSTSTPVHATPLLLDPPAEASRCTDDSAALAGADTSYNDFRAFSMAYTPHGPSERTMDLKLPETYALTAKPWQMLIRLDQPFAVFYTTEGTQRLIDSDATGNLYDADTDGVPDFAERVYNCLVEANTRYYNYYHPSDPEYAHFKWMHIQYNGTHRDTFYPVFIQPEDLRGRVEPWFQRDVASLLSEPPSVTYMNIDSSGTEFKRDADWLYPHLENTIYHEMFHTYQGFYKKNRDALGLERFLDL